MNDPASSASSPYDQSALDRLRRFGGDKLLSEMIALFREHAPTRLAAARAALDAGDVGGVRAALHALKSSAAQLGASRLSTRCAEGEALAERRATTGLDALVRAAAQDLTDAEAWLAAACPASRPPEA